jgi:uncharacterized protein (TIGR00369 family)
MEILDDNHCFVCGELNMSGLRQRPRIETVNQSASMRLVIPRAFQGWQGMVHGGILATLLDETCAYAAKGLVPQVVTAGISVTYKKPVPIETEVLVTASVVGRRRRIIEVQGQIKIAGELYAEASAKMFIVAKESQS